ncbi:Potassium transport protein 2 [Ceratocystis fimbriata CBS 114723]|uniref:Potassium transport protein n=1 Tax=Ceratocystis fimbriata CBS 114723 TaxID=1035309 RepID=A0A2C5X2X3_9PEZI|nr:Potassium transport protein 2 [Ceratocystis fimbriata CBS 114723]
MEESPPGFWPRLKTNLKTFLPTSKPHFSFITIHSVFFDGSLVVLARDQALHAEYSTPSAADSTILTSLSLDIAIVGFSLFGSVLVYTIGNNNLAYIDALFFSTGSSTQAGLNPVDVNLLNTGQQVVLYLIPMMANPIIMHSMVVYLRLYWFEKHFNQLVKEARLRRTTISKSRTKDQQQADPESQINRQNASSSSVQSSDGSKTANSSGGVRGRRITVMHSSGRPQRMAHDGAMLSPLPDVKSPKPHSIDTAANPLPSDSSQSSSTESETGSKSYKAPASADGDDSEDDGDISPTQTSPSRQPNRIVFGETVKRSDGVDAQTNFKPVSYGAGQLLSQGSTAGSEHVLERPNLSRIISVDGDEVLRIPNPREVEQGIVPTRVPRESAALYRPESRDDGLLNQRSLTASNANPNNRATIVISEPSRETRDHRPAQNTRNTRMEIAEEAEALKNTFSIFKMPRWLKRCFGREVDNEMPSAYRTRTFSQIRDIISGGEAIQDMPYLSYTPTTGRNSQFIGLSLEQREELGGIEYRSLRTLAVILGCYFWGFHIFGLCFLLPFIKHSNRYGQILDNMAINRTWWGFFTSGSAFMDLGFTLTPNSMYSFNSSTLVMLVMSFLIVIGNTGFPIMLRFIIWLLSLIVPEKSGLWEELRFLLDHPRRCFTLLFPSSPTWWLFGVLILFNGVDVILFIILDLKADVVTDLPVHTRILNALFQATSTRTAGFACLDISQLHPGVQVSYMIMMYISVYPIAISIRGTNVYEERSLGVYESIYESIYNEDEEEEKKKEDAEVSYVGTHLRRQLSFDIWYVCLGLFLLAIVEGSKVQDNKFTMWAVLFEVISAYGTVGMSLGYSGVNTSLSGKFSVIGKLVMIAMQIRGRHRGLPYGLDRAILLPSEQRFERETLVPPDLVPPLHRTMSARSRRGTLGMVRSRTSERNPGILQQLLHPGPALAHEFHKLPPVLPGMGHHHHQMPRSMSTATAAPRRRMHYRPTDNDEHDDSNIRHRMGAKSTSFPRSLTTN